MYCFLNKSINRNNALSSVTASQMNTIDKLFLYNNPPITSSIANPIFHPLYDKAAAIISR